MDKKVAIGVGILAAIGIYAWYKHSEAQKKSTIVTNVPIGAPPGIAPTSPTAVPYGATPAAPAGVPTVPFNPATLPTARIPGTQMAFSAMPSTYRYPA